MISVSGGLIVTRANSDNRVGQEFQNQLFGKSEPLLLSAGVLVLLALFPGLPTIPFLALGGALGSYGWFRRQKIAATVKSETPVPAETGTKDDLESLMRVEPLAIEVGLGLANLVVGGKTSPLLKRIAGIRRQFVSNLGYLLPPVRVTDNLSLRSREYVVLLKGSEIGRYELLPGSELAIPTNKADKNFPGQQTREPAFGLPALWITSDKVDAARGAGYTVVDAVNVMGTHLAELVRQYAAEMFSRQDAKLFCDRVAAENGKLVEDLVPKLLSYGGIQKVLQNLLRERVSVRDGLSILEALAEAAVTTKNPVLLTEYTRQAIRRAVVKPYLNQKGELPAFFLDPSAEQTVESAVQHTEQNSILVLSPQAVRDTTSRIERKLERREVPTVVVTSSGARYFLRQMLESSLPNVFPISHNEVPPGVKILSLGTL
jgi:flagellar biosynthesis protein FlhA